MRSRAWRGGQDCLLKGGPDICPQLRRSRRQVRHTACMNSRRSIKAALNRIYLGDAFQLCVIIAIVVFALFAGNGRIPAGQITAADRVRTLLWYGLVSGLASMATIEVAKRLFGLRSHYQRLQVTAWLRNRTAQPAPGSSGSARDGLVAEPGASGELDKAMGLDEESSHLQRRWLFDLPIDQLVAQVSSAVDIALADPAGYQLLLEAISGQATAAIAPAPAKAASAAIAVDPADAAVRATAAVQAGVATGASSAVPVGAAAPLRGAEESADSEFRRSQRVRSGLDQLQISVGGRWRRYVQGTALWLSGLYGILLVFITRAPSSARPEYIIGALLIGGMLSWVARDIAAVIERWRG
jgi:hypothetical protein